MSDGREVVGTTLATALLDAGLVLFGQFRRDSGAIWPVGIRLTLLPSYPALMQRVADALYPLLNDAGADRLLVTADTVPLGAAASLRSGLPLVYPQGIAQSHTAAFVFEGAYDVGHPTVLLTNELLDVAQAASLSDFVQRVGLELRVIVAVLDMERGAREALEATGFAVESLLMLTDVAAAARMAGSLPSRMHTHLLGWMHARPSAPG